jgi:hypothetical protein
MRAKKKVAEAAIQVPVVGRPATLLMATTFSVYSLAQNVAQSSIRAWRLMMAEARR